MPANLLPFFFWLVSSRVCLGPPWLFVGMSVVAGLALGAEAKKLVTPEMVESIGADTFSLKAIEAQYSLAVSDVINRLIPILNGRTCWVFSALYWLPGCAVAVVESYSSRSAAPGWSPVLMPAAD